MDSNALSEINPVHYRKTACPWAVTVEFEHLAGFTESSERDENSQTNINFSDYIWVSITSTNFVDNL